MSQALYRKWRPQRWEQVVGQEHVIQTLRNAIAADRVGHAYLFPGPRGTGKTTTARLLAKAVNCLDEDLTIRPCDACAHCLAVNQGRFFDLIEIDAASNTSVDDVRDLRDKINFAPTLGKFKVYIIDEVHMLSTAAFNALLKTLEEPPPHAIFVLATTEVHKIPATVLSRCQRHEFRRISSGEIVAQLQKIIDEEGFQVDGPALKLIARQATGSMRDAISLVDQLVASGDKVTLEFAQQVLGTATSQTVLDIVDALIAREPSSGLAYIHDALDAGIDPRQLARQIVEYLRDLLVVKVGNASQLDVSQDIRERMANHAQAFDVPQMLHIIKTYNNAATETRIAWQPSLPLELAFVEAIESPGQIQYVPVSDEPVKPRERKVSQPPKQVPAATKTTVPADQEDGVEEDEEVEGLTLKAVTKQWRKVLARAKQEKNQFAQALLNSCKILELRGHDLYLGFASDVLKSKMEKEENMAIAHTALADVFGVEVHVRCVISSGSQSELPPELDSEGMVATAIRLGGEIVDSREIKTRKKQ